MTFSHGPNPDCSNFDAPAGKNWCIRHGFHPTSAFGPIKCYHCKNCHRPFSDQTFSIDYYAKKTVDYSRAFEHLVTASGLIDISRAIDIRVETVQNRFERPARCCLSIHSELLPALPLQENMAADGLESLSFSWYCPHHINIFVGSVSGFIYSMGFATLRGRGSNENGNGLLRRFIPKDCDKGCYSKKKIREIQDWMNNYPRRILGGELANEVIRNTLGGLGRERVS